MNSKGRNMDKKKKSIIAGVIVIFVCLWFGLKNEPEHNLSKLNNQNGPGSPASSQESSTPNPISQETVNTSNYISEIDEDFKELKKLEESGRFDYLIGQIDRISGSLFGFGKDNYKCDWSEVTPERLEQIINAYIKTAEYYIVSFNPEFSIEFSSAENFKPDSDFDVYKDSLKKWHIKGLRDSKSSRSVLVEMSESKNNDAWMKCIYKTNELFKRFSVFYNDLSKKLDDANTNKELPLNDYKDLKTTLARHDDIYKKYCNYLRKVLFDIPAIIANKLFECWANDRTGRCLVARLFLEASDDEKKEVACAFSAITVEILAYSAENNTRKKWHDNARRIKDMFNEAAYKEVKGMAQILRTALPYIPRRVESWPDENPNHSEKKN